MQAHGGVELVVVQQGFARIDQFQTKQHCHCPAEQEEDDERHQVLDADDFVICAETEVPLPARDRLLPRSQSEPLAPHGFPQSGAEQPAQQREDIAQCDSDLDGRLIRDLCDELAQANPYGHANRGEDQGAANVFQCGKGSQRSTSGPLSAFVRLATDQIPPSRRHAPATALWRGQLRRVRRTGCGS